VVLALLALAVPSARAAVLPAQGSVEVLFTPWDDAERALLGVIGEARHTIHVQAYTLSSRNIGRALEAAKQRGVAVEILADREQAERNEYSQLQTLSDSGIPVWYEVRYAAAHNKIMIIDGEESAPIVVTGSYNFSFAAQARNAENLLILRGNAPLARAYLANWRRHRQDAEPFSR
jgi:phosphatidylserine/phosphatidylglycerophosphate/cardiolipin synthase-like enzyme